MSSTIFRRSILLALLGLALVLPGAALAQDRGGSAPPGSERQLLDRLGNARVYRSHATDEVSLIGAPDRQRAIARPAGLSAGASPENAARTYLSEYGKLFGLRDQASELRAREIGSAGKGRALVRFQQVHEGVPVLGGQLNVEVTDANELLVANGEVLPGVSLDTEPAVSAGEARQSALAKIAKERGMKAGELRASDPRLWIYDPTLLGGPGIRTPHLVWRTEVTPAKGLADMRELVLVDAKLGNVALNFDQIDNAKDRNTYDTNNTSALPGTLVCDESNACTDSTYDADVRAAHLHAGQTYDFYSNNHNRDSIDNAGMTIVSTADYCPSATQCPYRNAFWNGQQMVYGNGFAAADDVVGHELTHGVTQHESHLFYYYQSGAINESFSDVWGEFIDLTNGAGTDTDAVRWLMGEDIPGIGAIRDMQDPTAFGDPDKMTSTRYANPQPDNSNIWDRGGVHTNSGVNNKAAYLMTDGDTFNGITVTGLGITKVAKIYYEAQTNLLTSASDYQNLYAALQQSCANLTGTSGITSADCQEVKDAVDATEMNTTPTNAPSPEAPVCDTGQTATTLFNDDLENPASGNWIKTGNWFYPQNPNGILDATYATSGDTNFWGYDQGSKGDYAIAKATGVAIPAGKTTYLRFNHSYQFEDDANGAYDGGVLEYSTDGGSTWQDAGSLIVDNGYNGTISNNYDNPLKGKAAFVRESNGYVSSRVDLSTLAGQNVRFRFRIGTDTLGDDYGWFIDDVNVYTCGFPTTTAITSDEPDPSVVGQAVTVNYSVGQTAGSGTPTGSVTVSDGTQSCTGTVEVGSCDITFTSAGAKSLTATYAGEGNFSGSTSAAEAHQVDKAHTTTTIASDNPDPSAGGQAVTVKYGVTADAPGSGTPTGNVTVSDGTQSCTATVADGECTITFATDGSRTLTATYTGDDDFDGSTSAGESHTVDATAPTVAIDRASDQADPTSSSPIHFTVKFSEPVSGFDKNDVTLGGTANADTALVTETSNDGTTYDVAVSGMTRDGDVTAGIPADAAQDRVGNGNEASTSTDNAVNYNFNVAPTATATNGQCTINIASGTINITLSDPDGDPMTLTFDPNSPKSNTNTTLVPNNNVQIGGSGKDRTISVTAAPRKSGTATLTFDLSDGTVTVPVVITVKVGSDKNETLGGTSGTDMIFGLGGRNTINGNAGNDLLCGGNANDTINGGDGNDIIDGANGNDVLRGDAANDILRGSAGDDTLTGGTGADSFSGGSGTDTAADYNTSEGDIKDDTIP